MKSSLVIAIFLSLISVGVFAAEAERMPVPMLFDKNQPWTQEEVQFGDEKWMCIAFDGNICTEVDRQPGTFIFNKNRKWNPEKVVWNNAFWGCAKWRKDGTCSKVEKLDITVE